MRTFSNRELEASDRIERHIRRGGTARGSSAMSALHPVEAIQGSVVVHQNVLVPRSQPLIHLLRRALEAVRPDLPPAPIVLDMGCGSGVCSVLAAQVFPGAHVTATDLLPEAAASTKINAGRFGLADHIRVAEPGNLFQTVADNPFDLMIFNAPWVVAPVRSRLETALNDRDQQTVRRFLREASERLSDGGRIILGYADHSGPKAIARLEAFVHEAGLNVRQRHADRIKTHRSNRPWQAIYAYDLARG